MKLEQSRCARAWFRISRLESPGHHGLSESSEWVIATLGKANSQGGSRVFSPIPSSAGYGNSRRVHRAREQPAGDPLNATHETLLISRCPYGDASSSRAVA